MLMCIYIRKRFSSRAMNIILIKQTLPMNPMNEDWRRVDEGWFLNWTE